MAAAQLATTAVRAATARRASSLLAAESRLGSARIALGKASLAYASDQAEYERAVGRADLVRALSNKASTTAVAARRALALRVRSMLRQPSTATFNAMLGENPGDDLLVHLNTLDTLSRLTTNLAEVRARVAADTRRDEALHAQDVAARAMVAQIPIAQSRAALQDAQADQDAASDALAALTAPTPDPSASIAAAQTDLDLSLLSAVSAAGWTRPTVGRITDPFGPRPVHPVPGVGDFHRGTDIGSDCDAAVYAATDGVVEAAEVFGTYGNWILISHGHGIETGYAHIADGETLVKVGETVVAGQVIAGVGDTGAATGCHLHFEVRLNGTAVDAVPFLAKRGVKIGN